MRTVAKQKPLLLVLSILISFIGSGCLGSQPQKKGPNAGAIKKVRTNADTLHKELDKEGKKQ